MALAPFYGRIYSAVGRHISVSRESLSKVLAQTQVGVTCSELSSHNQRMIAEMAVNLAARLYPTLALDAPTEEDRDWMRNLARAVNPKIDFVDEAPAEYSVIVGTSGPEKGIFASASGWVAMVGQSPPLSLGPTNPYASVAAAALALSEIFRRVFLKRTDSTTYSLSLLDYSRSNGADLELEEVSIGEVLLVGVGAVGNAAIWAMARDPITTGDLRLLDHETISRSNLQRYVLATTSEVDEYKVEVAEKILASSGFSATSIRTTLENYLLENGQPPTTCISLDNVDGRRAAQALLPNLVVNGWTGEASLGASWHVFDNEQACLACLYHPHGQGLTAIQQAALAFGLDEKRAADLWIRKLPMTGDERRRAAKKLGVAPTALSAWREKPLGDLYTDVVCGAVPIDLPGIKNIEVVPLAHQSVLAGAMMAAELLKRTQPKLSAIYQKEPLARWDDVLLSPPKNWLRPRPREDGCICGDPIYQDVFRSKWR